MDFVLISSKHFQKQFNELDENYKRLIKSKLDLAKQNPYRFKALKIKNHKLFRIRLTINSKEVRLIYKVLEPNVIILCLLERKKDYKDLRKYLQ